MRTSLLINPAKFPLEKLSFFNKEVYLQINEFTDISLKLLENKTIKYFIIGIRGKLTDSILTVVKQCKVMFPSLITILISDELGTSKLNLDNDSAIDHCIYFQNNYTKLETDLITIAWHYESMRIEQFPVLQVQDLIVNPNSKQVTRNGIPIHLTRKEFDLLEFLICNKGNTVSRLTILEAVWGYSPDSFSNTVDVHFTKLRKKVDSKFKVKFLHTVHCVGYKFDESQQKLL